MVHPFLSRKTAAAVAEIAGIAEISLKYIYKNKNPQDGIKSSFLVACRFVSFHLSRARQVYAQKTRTCGDVRNSRVLILQT